MGQDFQLDRTGAKTSFNYAEDHQKIKKLIVVAKETSPVMRETIAYLNTEIFGEMDRSARDIPGDSGEEAVDELDNLLEGFAFDEDDEAPPTVDKPCVPRDITEAAPLSRNPSPNPPETAKAAAGSSSLPIAESSDGPTATPPVPQKKKRRPKRVLDSEGTMPDAAPIKATRPSRKKAVVESVGGAN